MNWVKKILSGGLGGLMAGAEGIIGKIQEGKIAKREAMVELERLAQAQQERLHAEILGELAAKERVLVAELQQGDSYTKRARPTIIYAGLVGIILQGFQSWTQFQLPTEFWYAWSGLVGTYVIGRSAEKRGVNGTASKIVKMVTGGRESRLAG